MCINKRIQEKLEKKAALDAEIANLEELAIRTEPIKSMLNQLIEDYRLLAPEELGDLLAEIAKTCDNYFTLYCEPDSKPEAEVWGKSAIAPALENLYQEAQSEPQYEPDKAYDTVESILEPTGFQHQHLEQFFTFWDAKEKYESYRGWDVYFSVPNGGIVAIGLHNITKSETQAWDASTEMIQELDSTFPESLADFDEIVAWTRQLIDRVESLEILEAQGQLRLPLDVPAASEELGLDNDDEVLGLFKIGDRIVCTAEGQQDFGKHGVVKRFTKNRNLVYSVDGSTIERILDIEQANRLLSKEEAVNNALDSKSIGFVDIENEFKVKIYPQHSGEALVGVTFRFLSLTEKNARGDEGKCIFSKSLLAAEIADRPYKRIARDLIQDWRDQENTKAELATDPYKALEKPEDKFVELVKLSNAVAYLKRRDNGELIAAYAAFSNATQAGEKTATKAKSRARKWAEWLTANFAWICSEPRVCKRMISDNPKQEFAYELKITGKFSIGQLTMLATEEDLSLLPGEVAPAPTTESQPVAEAAPSQVFRVKINSYEVAAGEESEMRSRFESELLKLGDSQMSASLFTSSEVIECYRVADFNFVEIEDFDSDNPEYKVLHRPSQQSFNVWRKLAPGTEEIIWRNSIYPYEHFVKREAAAVDAVRRLLKAQSAE